MSALPINPEPSEAKLIAEEARRLFALGVLTFPASRTAKHPDRVKHWAAEHYPADGWPTAQQHSEMFSHHDVARMFVVCGARSGNIASFDFDQAGYFEQWAALLPDELYDRLYVEQSQRSGGYHVAVKTTESVLSCCPARDPRKPDGTDGNIRVEIRGEGTGFTAAPSVGYQRIQGDLAALPMLTPDEYRILIDAAAMFNECAPRPQPERKARTVRPADEDELPGTRYNCASSQSDVLDLFARHGWTIGRRSGDTVSITRPGATSETSGNVNADGVTHIFSSNTPFEPSVAGHGNPHAPFAAYAILEHGGDYHAAAKTLYAQYTPPAVRIAKAHNLDVDAETGEILPPSAAPPPINERILAEPPPKRPFTDTGNAERLADRHGRDLRYCHTFGKWFVYDERRWRRDDTDDVARRAKETTRAIYAEAEQAETKEEREAIAKHAIRSEAEQRRRAMVNLTASEIGIPVRPDDLDANAWLFNVENGTIDLRSGLLRAHDRQDLITKVAPVVYDPNAVCPRFDAFLARILPSQSLRRFVQKAIGHSLTGDTREDVIFINYGNGSNGKTTLMQTIQALFGDYASQTSTDTLMIKRNEGVPNDVAALKGARLVAASEGEEGKRLAESLIKSLTGGDKISARFMRAEWFEFEPTFKIWLSTNHKPIIRGTDTGIWRRIRLIPFAVTIPEEECDETLPEKLRAELPGILNWALEGCRDWLENGLGMPDEVKQATQAFRDEMDILARFIEDCCIEHKNAFVSAAELYGAYRRWAEDNGERYETQTGFGKRLRERGFADERKSGKRGWVGISLPSHEVQDEF